MLEKSADFDFISRLKTTNNEAIAYSNWQRGKMGETEKSLKDIKRTGCEISNRN